MEKKRYLLIIDNDIYIAAKILATKEKRTLNKLVEDAIRTYLEAYGEEIKKYDKTEE